MIDLLQGNFAYNAGKFCHVAHIDFCDHKSWVIPSFFLLISIVPLTAWNMATYWVFSELYASLCPSLTPSTWIYVHFWNYFQDYYKRHVSAFNERIAYNQFQTAAEICLCLGCKSHRFINYGVVVSYCPKPPLPLTADLMVLHSFSSPDMRKRADAWMGSAANFKRTAAIYEIWKLNSVNSRKFQRNLGKITNFC